MTRILLWYRRDLRLHDHEPLATAIAQSADLIPLYCFDPRAFGQTAFGFPKTGAFRAQFLLESVAELRAQWQARGSNLLVRWGKPEVIILELVETQSIDAVYGAAEVTSEETRVERKLTKALGTVPLRLFELTTLIHPTDLPWAIAEIPGLFTRFRKTVEQNWQIRPLQPTPQILPSLPPDLDPGQLPTWERLNLTPPPRDDRGVLPFHGGEAASLDRLHQYFWERDRLRSYKETRNGMLGVDYSAKFSPWLALGCLSPRYIYTQVRTYEAERVANDSTYWLIFELLWRDYFRFIAQQGGDRLFKPEGLQGIKLPWQQAQPQFERWCQGQTGYPLVDANMRELEATGFISNRGRQNVASFLTKNLGIDWRMGAEWFEYLLIDYDVCSNYGNWNYTAGVGNDARGFRYFNILKQSQIYDLQGDYVRHWLPELAALPPHLVHQPWRLNREEQTRYQVRLGVDYPQPMVDFFKSVKHYEAIYNKAVEASSK
ncbi:MAG: DASH family cryptochrome [Spirulina sp. SIO3F2]|nr:DASH family cryptochrome [Spirulina sp. SIO3F2]